MNFIMVLALLILLGLGGRWVLKKCEAANVVDWGNRWINRLDGLNRLFCRHFHRLDDQKIALPARGGAVVVSNHVSGLDPLLLIAASPRPLRFLIAREEYERWWLTWLFRAVGCIPVDRAENPRAAAGARGRNVFGDGGRRGRSTHSGTGGSASASESASPRVSVAAFAEAQRRLAAGEVVALFPHGKIHLDRDPPQPLKRGAALLARAAGVPIVAVRLDGVRGQGLTVSAVFLRSRVRLRHHVPLHPASHEADQLLARLAQLLSPPPVDEKI